jgi:hypothetical protein
MPEARSRHRPPGRQVQVTRQSPKAPHRSQNARRVARSMIEMRGGRERTLAAKVGER